MHLRTLQERCLDEFFKTFAVDERGIVRSCDGSIDNRNGFGISALSFGTLP